MLQLHCSHPVARVANIVLFFVKFTNRVNATLQNKFHFERLVVEAAVSDAPPVNLDVVVSKFLFKISLSVGGAVLRYRNKSV